MGEALSIAVWFVIPRMTVFFRYEPQPDALEALAFPFVCECSFSVSVSVSSSSVNTSSSSSSSLSSGEWSPSTVWFVNPLHTVSASLALSVVLSALG